jgi:UDP-N-acetylglucosamine--N-acetylmuramyl-(pentapeptide) pyrophosphoryl-undecaprenol N-acetylglucosamine transferase
MPETSNEGPSLLVAATGGHLAELHALRPRFVPEVGQVEWATFDTGQSRYLLSGEIVHCIPRVEPKDLPGVLRNAGVARGLLKRRSVVRVISTGAGVALPYFVMARQLGLPAHYVESAARTEGPSLTGRMVSRLPGVHLYGQHAWKSRRWSRRGSVFDAFQSSPSREVTTIDKVVVTFGTQRGFSFRRAAEKLVAVLPEVSTPSVEILWQTGATDTTGLGVKAVESVPYAELDQAVADADLVISHAGVGSALQALTKGKIPVLLPRRRAHGEHTDDHQRQLASVLQSRELAVHAEVGDLTASDLLAAHTRIAFPVPELDFQLEHEHRR